MWLNATLEQVDFLLDANSQSCQMSASSANLAALWMLKVSQYFLCLFFCAVISFILLLSAHTDEVSTFRQTQKSQVRLVH